MDALVGEFIMHKIEYKPDGKDLKGYYGGKLAMMEFPPDATLTNMRWEIGDGWRRFSPALPHFSTCITDAWQVVEQWGEFQIIFKVGLYRVAVHISSMFVVSELLPLAICQAALIACNGYTSQKFFEETP